MILRLQFIHKIVNRVTHKLKVLFLHFRHYRQSNHTSKKLYLLQNGKSKHILSYLSSTQFIKKIRYAIAICVVIFVFGAAVHFVRQIYALTLYFTQSDWSGGADTVTTINSTNSTGWTKFYSKTAGIDETTSGEIKMKLETSP